MTEPASWVPALSVRSLRKSFMVGTPDERIAIDGIDLDIEPGGFYVIIGSNGAGKSTLLNIVGGRIVPDAGTIRIKGADVTSTPVHRRARHVARVFQDPMLGTAASMTVEENLLLAEFRSRKRSWRRGLTPTRIACYRDRLAVLGLGLENRLGSVVGLLSGGQRQALSLIMAIGSEPDVLLLDEHTAALDPKTAAQIMKATVACVRGFRLTALMVTHNMQHATDYGTGLIMMDAGRIRLLISGQEKAALTVPDLVSKFEIPDDKILLASKL